MQSLILFGLIILMYLMSKMVTGYSQMIQELKYLRSKIHSGVSFEQDDPSSSSKPVADNTAQATTAQATTAQATTNAVDNKSGGGKVMPKPQGIANTSLKDVFNSFHLPTQISNYVPILKSLDINRMTKSDIYEPFNSYSYDTSPQGVSSSTVINKPILDKMSREDRTYTRQKNTESCQNSGPPCLNS